MRNIAFVSVVASTFLAGAALAQIAQPLHFQSNGTTSATPTNLVQGGAGELASVAIGNPLNSSAWLKLYDKATAPTCGTDVPVQTFLIATQATFSFPLAVPFKFLKGIGICFTGALSDTDTSTVATGIVVDFGVK
jgi:hypothetical protein